MRELKFRVWVDDEKRFRYCEYIPTMGFVWMIAPAVGEEIPQAATLEFLEIGENYPQQYTGMKDSKGNDIFEGDIVSVKLYEDWHDEVGYDVIHLVKWCDVHKAFRGFTPKMLKSNYSGSGLPEPIKILGNSCENPDLLK